MCIPAALSTAMVQADPTNVRAATRAATCHIKMGQLTEATAVLEAVKATVPAGHPVPSDLASKQSNLEPNEWLQMYFCMIVSACGCDLALLPCAC